jgi:DNA-binding CsgD family transcriptional regulator
MQRRSPKETDRALLRDISSSIDCHELGAPPVLSTIAEPMRVLLNAAFSVSYGLSPAGESMRCDFWYTQLPSAMRVDLDASLAATSSLTTWATYDPRCPASDQRNRVCSFPIKQLTTTGAYAVLRKYGVNTAQIRVLMCEGPSLLAWVGAFRDDAFTDRERSLLARIITTLRRRLVLERRLQEADAKSSLLEVALERIASAAFVTDARGHVLHANVAGRAVLDRNARELLPRLAAAQSIHDSEFEIHAITARGVPLQRLVFLREPTDLCAARVARAAQCWSLTGRQSEVLHAILRGQTNARISAELQISERTVEVHVTAILERAQCVSRAALISSALTMR